MDKRLVKNELIDNIRTKITDASTTVTSGKNLSVKQRVDLVAKLMDEAGNMAFNTQLRDGSFNNSKLKLGLSDTNLNSSEYIANMLTFDRYTIIELYHGNWIFRRIVDKVAQDMWSSGITINGDFDSNALNKVYKRYSRLSSELIYATEQARLFGGAASLMMIDDGQDDLSKPLNLNGIKKGASIRLFTTDRWYGLETSTELVKNYKSIDYGKPKYYTFYLENAGEGRESFMKVHHSRVLRFVNRRTVKMLESRLMGWGISELEHIYQILMAHDTTNMSSVSLVGKALLEIVKVNGMRGMMSGLSMGNAGAQSQLAAQLTALNNYRNMNNLVMMDKEDEYDRKEYQFTGLTELLQNQQELIAGAAEMPQVLIYGQTKGGMTSDSPAEMEFYANTILGKQEAELRPILDKLLPILFRVEGLEIPDDLDYDFVSIAGLTEEKKENMLNTVVQAISTLTELGIMTKETALEELKQKRDQTGFGNCITKRDEELAKEMDEQKPEEESEDLEGMGGDVGTDLEQSSDMNQEPENLSDDYAEVKEQVLNKNKKLFDKYKKIK